MPRIRVTTPDQLLQVAAARAEALGTNVDELYAEAIERYVEATKDASAGSVRSRMTFPRSSPKIAIEIPEELFQRADKAAKRQGKRREVLYADALAYHLASAGPSDDSALDQGHDLPSGAWRPTGPSSEEVQ
jgi:metal-responsive CopG/Arc/MetJ family transcriptional regulator